MKKLCLFLGLIVTIMLVASSCGSADYETVKGDPMHSRIYTLDNGLKVYLAVNKETPRIQTYIAVRVGGKNDPAETTGLAHYFEHLMFKGTPNFGTQNYEAEAPLLDQIEGLFEVYRKTTDEAERAALYHQIDSISYVASGYAIPNEYDKLMAAIGADGTNAYTSYDQTVYVEDIPANQIENWARIQADRFRNPVIRGFHTELETIYEEKNMSLTNDGRKVLEQMLTALFPNHPYGSQTVLGTQEHLKNPSITNVRNYHATWYVPNNMAVCMSGDFDPDQTIAIIKKYFGDMTPNPELPTLDFGTVPAITSPKVVEVLGLDPANVSLGWVTGGISSIHDSDMMSILSSILYNGQAGIIDLDLNQQQKVLSSYATYLNLADHGALWLQGRPKAGQSLDEVKDLLLGELAKLKAGDFDEKIIEATINNFKLSRMQYLDSNDGRADAFVTAFVNNLAWKDVVEELDRISKITKEDVVNYANEHFTDQNYVLVYKREGKDPSEVKMSKPALTPIQTNRDAVSPLLAEIASTPVKPIEPVFVDFDRDMDKLTAKSDIEVLYKKNTTTDMFQLTYLYEVGSNNDKTINTAASYLQYLGTAEMTAEQLASEFYDIACSFDISAGAERTQITISGLAENMGRAMELTESLLGGAVANEDILAMMKTDMFKSRTDAKLRQANNFSRLQTYAMYGADYIKNNTMTDAELAALTSEELLGKIRAFSGQEHRILYYGPADHKALLAEIEQHHNVAETLAPVAEKVTYTPLLTPENEVLLAEYDAAQIYYFQASNRGEVYDPTKDAISSLYNSYFGGGMNSIVFQEMREARGLAYSAQAVLRTPSKLDIPYIYIAFIATQNDKMRDAAEAFEDIINDMPESEAAFNIAKESLVANIRTERIIKSGVLDAYIAAEDLGIDYDRRKPIYEQLPSLTLADVTAFQQEWVKDRKYKFCILGRSADLDTEYLNTLGPVQRLTQQEIFGY
ncbi:MAG: insulinase family protein [Rikenellaceae bacterium]|nr:insulinase family protein [Rikenellaceae bacterium]